MLDENRTFLSVRKVTKFLVPRKEREGRGGGRGKPTSCSSPISTSFDKIDTQTWATSIPFVDAVPLANPLIPTAGGEKECSAVDYFTLGGSTCLPTCVKGGGYYGVTKVLYGLPKPHKDSPQARTPVIVCVCIFHSLFFSLVRARESSQPLYVQWRWRGHRVTRAGSHPNDRNLNAHSKTWLVVFV